MGERQDPVLLMRVASMPFDALDGFHDRECAIALDRVCDLEQRVSADARALEDELYAQAGPAAVAVAVPEPVAVAVQASVRHALLKARRDVHNRRRQGVEQGLRRIATEEPRLGERLRQFAALLLELEEALDAYRSLHEEALVRGAVQLVRLAREPLVEEGLRLSGRSLASEAVKLESISPARWTHRQRHVALKVLAYLGRFASKTSPNGVFCSTAIGAFGDRASCLGDNAITRRETLLAVGEARKITACLAVDPELASMVVPRTNPTVRMRDDAWIFWRPASPRHANDDEVLSTIRVHPVAQALLAACAPGRTLPAVISETSMRTGISTSELEPFARRLAASGLLIAEVELPWSERRPLACLAAEVRSAGHGPSWLAEVETLEREVDELDALPWNERRGRLDRIAARAEGLPHDRPLDHDALLRVDTASGFRVELPRSTLTELASAMHWYARLCASLYPREVVLESYARRFLARFPADHDVEVLDVYHDVFDDRGDGRAVAFPPSRESASGTERRLDPFENVREMFAQAARNAQRDGRDEVSLDRLDWDDVLGTRISQRWSCGVLFQVAARDVAAIEAGRYRLVLNSIYPGGGLASARLADFHAGTGPIEDGPIARELRANWQSPDHDGAIVAEVSFMHGARTANAGLRPSLFRHEIELPGDRATPEREVIPLSDLVVRFDSAARRFHLRSRSRGLEVKPIVSSGISPHGVVSFLVAVGQQHLQPLPYFPGFDVEGIAYWPRFTLGRTVVFRRRWTVALPGLPATERAALLDGRHMREVAAWRRRHELPRHVFVHTPADPKPFYVDLESPWAVALLSARLAEGNGTTGRVTEMLPEPHDMWATDSKGRYASEFLVHLRSTSPEGAP